VIGGLEKGHSVKRKRSRPVLPVVRRGGGPPCGPGDRGGKDCLPSYFHPRNTSIQGKPTPKDVVHCSPVKKVKAQSGLMEDPYSLKGGRHGTPGQAEKKGSLPCVH